LSAERCANDVPPQSKTKHISAADEPMKLDTFRKGVAPDENKNRNCANGP
jgi:hypothetical protein